MFERKRAFTLHELLIVFFIMTVLAGIMLPALRKARERGRVIQARNEINQVITAIRMYAEDWGVYPVVDSSVVENSSAELMDALADYMDIGRAEGDNLIDPWGNPYRYRYDPSEPGQIEGREAGVGFNLFSAGPDRQYETPHDITNW